MQHRAEASALPEAAAQLGGTGVEVDISLLLNFKLLDRRQALVPRDW